MSHDAYSALSDPTRRRILEALRGGPRPVGELVTELEVSQPTVSKHLKVLRDAQMVVTRAQGQKRFYSLTAEPLTGVVTWLEDLISAAAETDEARPAVAAPAATEDDAAAPVPAPGERSLPWFTAEVTEITETDEGGVVEPEDEVREGTDEKSVEPRESAVGAQDTPAEEDREASGEDAADEAGGAPEPEEPQVTPASVETGDHAPSAARPKVEDDVDPRDGAPRTTSPEAFSAESAEALRPRGGAHRRQSGLLSTLTGFRRRGRGTRRD